MASHGMMPFESTGRQGPQRAKPPCCGRCDPTCEPTTAGWDLHPVEPVVDHLLCLILLVTVSGLDPPLELLAAPIDLGNVIVGELAPLLLHLARHLLPVALDAVPIHRGSLSSLAAHCAERSLCG